MRNHFSIKMHLGLLFDSKLDFSRLFDGNALPVVASCRDLGVMLASDLSPSIQIGEIVRKAHQRANAILRCFETRDKELLVRTFTTYVRPLLEYNSVIWSPHLKKRHRGY